MDYRRVSRRFVCAAIGDGKLCWHFDFLHKGGHAPLTSLLEVTDKQ